MTMQYEIDRAYYQGLREGFDPEVAEDLGIPMSPESVERQQSAAKRVAAIINTVNRTELVDGGIEHEKLNEQYGRVVCANCNRPGCSGCGKS